MIFFLSSCHKFVDNFRFHRFLEFKVRERCLLFESTYFLYKRQNQQFEFHIDFFVMFQKFNIYFLKYFVQKSYTQKFEAEIQHLGTHIYREGGYSH